MGGRWHWAGLALVVAACGSGSTGPMIDEGVASDFSLVALADLAGPTNDLASALDLARPSPDLATVIDLAQPSDDLSLLMPDLSLPLPDLTQPLPDLTLPADLSPITYPPSTVWI